MMGLVTIQSIADYYGHKNVAFYCDFNEYADIDEIKKELNGDDISINTYTDTFIPKTNKIRIPAIRQITNIWNLIFFGKRNKIDMFIVLGGDNLSEYYSKTGVFSILLRFWLMSFSTRVVLLGQTLGPFEQSRNRLVVKYLLPKLSVFVRDKWSADYMKQEFRLDIPQMADLAFNDLPRQSFIEIESEVLQKYHLKENKYFTVVISGLIKDGYYCNDVATYLSRYKEMLISVLNKLDINLVLLAHTFPPYGNESEMISELFKMFPNDILDRVVLIKEKILPTRARFVLGNGLFTITGRMHPAVSTYQMGKPAICFSYSTKYEGVVGRNINRNDLIIEANDNLIWQNGKIVTLLEEKIDYLISHYDQIIPEIKSKVLQQKKIVVDTLNNLY